MEDGWNAFFGCKSPNMEVELKMKNDWSCLFEKL